MLELLFAVSQLPADDILAGHGRSNRTACNAEVSQITSCFCAISQMHAFYHVLHALGQDQTNDPLLVRKPKLTFYCALHALDQHQANELFLWECPQL